jgi:hypothetical protein
LFARQAGGARNNGGGKLGRQRTERGRKQYKTCPKRGERQGVGVLTNGTGQAVGRITNSDRVRRRRGRERASGKQFRYAVRKQVKRLLRLSVSAGRARNDNME